MERVETCKMVQPRTSADQNFGLNSPNGVD
jgi:hypothetical protein